MNELIHELNPKELDVVSGGAGADYIIHTVQLHDTLGKIAKRYQTTVQAIMALNPIITNPDRIQPGWSLKIPK